MRDILLLFLFIISGELGFSQTFMNGDLEGPYAQVSGLAPGWQAVYYTDATCMADNPFTCTPDLLSIIGPIAGSGFYGQPYSGNTFAAGNHSAYDNNDGTGLHASHEGIKQTVNTFNLNIFYEIGFYQSVVKHAGARKNSGSWMIFANDSLLHISDSSYSDIYYMDTDLFWDKRGFVFQPFEDTLTLKFLPYIGDTLTEPTSPNGVYMGIDSIWLKPFECDDVLELPDTLTACLGDTVPLDAYMINATYNWSTGSNAHHIETIVSGVYSVEVVIHDCPQIDSLLLIDSVVVEFVYPPVINFDSTTFYCDGDTVILNAANENYFYEWHDGSTDSIFISAESDTCWVFVYNDYCSLSDTTIILPEYCADELIVEMPNVFSPNGDGINDLFKPVILDHFVNARLTIINRWGNEIFSITSGTNVFWDGTDLEGTMVTEGVYFWSLEAKDEFGDNYLKNGFVHLMR